MANKRKTTTAIVAGVTAVALLLGGTFAWTSISQQAKNEAIVDINPGGRLHDDFNGTNKDVYVENFGDNITGVPIYARIRLDQYFEVGQDAGKNKDTPMADRNVEAKIGTEINDVTTWVTYKPSEDLSSPVQANTNWQWKLGNEADNMPYYMPTFNVNKDSLAADINGTYEGSVEGDNVHYDDYKVYSADSIETGTEVYDWDEDTNEESEELNNWDNGGITNDDTTPIDSADVYHKSTVTNEAGETVDLTHTAQPISTTAEVITMAQWMSTDTANGGKSGQPGPYWVYDTDGWAYWAQPIAPGETTGLLLDGINMSKVPDDNYYYGINVVAQFATAGDIQAFNSGNSTDETWTSAAEDFFAIVTGTEAITINGVDSVAIVNGNTSTATFTATRTVAGKEAATQPTFTWTATDAEGASIDGVTITADGGVLSVTDTVADGTAITVTATAGDGTATADGETDSLSASKVVIVEHIPAIMYSLTDDSEQKVIDQSLELSGDVYNITYDMKNTAGEVILLKLNRDLDVDTILSDSGNVSEFASYELAEDGDENDTLKITLTGSYSLTKTTIDGIVRPNIPLIIKTEYGETIHVNLMIEMTEYPDLKLLINGTETTGDITIQASNMLFIETGAGGFNGAYWAYFYDENGQLLADYSFEEPYINFADTVTEDKTVTLLITFIKAKENGFYYKNFENVTMSVSAE